MANSVISIQNLDHLQELLGSFDPKEVLVVLFVYSSGNDVSYKMYKYASIHPQQSS